VHDCDNVADDPRFFVFEEELKETVLCFSRDSWVWQNSAYIVHAPIEDKHLHVAVAAGVGSNANVGNESSNTNTNANSNAGAGLGESYSNVQPFLGFSIYTAPLCYIYSNRPSLYSVSRSLWARLWCKLNVISGDSGTLLHVCATFENLLTLLNPTLFLHMLNIGVRL